MKPANERTAVREWMTAGEAADYLRLPSVGALYQRVARGQVKPLRLGRQMRFRRRDLDALMRAA
jgi:excisionase family DNA binding protein